MIECAEMNGANALIEYYVGEILAFTPTEAGLRAVDQIRREGATDRAMRELRQQFRLAYKRNQPKLEAERQRLLRRLRKL